MTTNTTSDAERNAGVWIDHRKAQIVYLDSGVETTRVLLSQVEKHPSRTGDSPLHGRYDAQQVPADDSRQRALTGELNGYYDAVIAALDGYERVLVFGPGEAKGELRSRLEKKHPGSHVFAVETTDRMTDRQVVAKVREHFAAAR